MSFNVYHVDLHRQCLHHQLLLQTCLTCLLWLSGLHEDASSMASYEWFMTLVHSSMALLSVQGHGTLVHGSSCECSRPWRSRSHIFLWVFTQKTLLAVHVNICSTSRSAESVTAQLTPFCVTSNYVTADAQIQSATNWRSMYLPFKTKAEVKWCVLLVGCCRWQQWAACCR